MKFSFVNLIILFFLASCNSHESISGEVQNVNISLTDLYGATDAQYSDYIQAVKQTLDSMKNQDEDGGLAAGLMAAHQRGVLRQANLILKEDNTQNTICLYIDSIEFNKKRSEMGIRNYSDLSNKRLWLRFSGELLYESLPTSGIAGNQSKNKFYYTHSIDEWKLTEK